MEKEQLLKNFESFVDKVYKHFDPERQRQKDSSVTPLNRVPRENSQTTPITSAQKKKWPFIFKYPFERIKDDPVSEKLSIPELKLASGDITKIVTAIFYEMRTYGDDLLDPSEEQYTQAARSAVLKWPHLENLYDSIHSRLNNQFI